MSTANQVSVTSGIVYDMPDSDYRSALGVSISALKHMAQTPAHFLHALTHKLEPTPAIQKGTIIHGCCLEGRPLESMVVAKPVDMSFASKEGKAWKASQTLPVFPAEDVVEMAFIIESVRAHPIFQMLMKEGKAEVSAFAKNKWVDIQMKGRFDLLSKDRKGNPVILDIKTCQDASSEAFGKTIADRLYFNQAAYYSDLYELNTGDIPAFVFLAVETVAPYGCQVFFLNHMDIELGQKMNAAWLLKLKECQESNKWPCYPTSLQEAVMPSWVRKNAIY